MSQATKKMLLRRRLSGSRRRRGRAFRAYVKILSANALKFDDGLTGCLREIAKATSAFENFGATVGRIPIPRRRDWTVAPDNEFELNGYPVGQLQSFWTMGTL